MYPNFETVPPNWVIKGKFFDRNVCPTGFHLDWRQSGAGNLLLKRSIFQEKDALFRPEFGRGGEDRDFFRRMMLKGMRFTWCAEAAAFESIPSRRLLKRVMIKRAFIRGTNPDFSVCDYLKSVSAIPCYGLVLPLFILLSEHLFMQMFISLCDHIGRIIYICGFDIIKERYIT